MDQSIWDDMAAGYDKSVEDNKDPMIASYLRREIDIVANLCRSICESSNNCSIIDMGAGTGRVIFALGERLQKYPVQFYGIEISEPMLVRANKKAERYGSNSHIKFLRHDLTDPGMPERFKSGTNIVMCLYNTLGVIPPHRRQRFIDSMVHMAQGGGLAIIAIFNGDDFDFVAPRLYAPMMPMIRQIDEDSFDKENRVFQNRLGFCSQWFTRTEINAMLHSNVEPDPIDVTVDGMARTFGNVFVNRKI